MSSSQDGDNTARSQDRSDARAEVRLPWESAGPDDEADGQAPAAAPKASAALPKASAAAAEASAAPAGPAPLNPPPVKPASAAHAPVAAAKPAPAPVFKSAAAPVAASPAKAKVPAGAPTVEPESLPAGAPGVEAESPPAAARAAPASPRPAAARTAAVTPGSTAKSAEASSTPAPASVNSASVNKSSGKKAPPVVPAEVGYESPVAAEPVHDDLGPKPGGGMWTIPMLCAGIALIACCVLIPQADVNRRLAYEREKLKADLESVEKQVAINAEFLRKVGDDPNLAERLAQRQMKIIREGTRVLELKKDKGLLGEMSPFHLVNVAGPPPVPPYQPVGGTFAQLCYDPRSRLYLMGGGLLLVATGLVLGYGPKD